MLTLTRIKARNLVPGTIVRNEDGERLYAAFDVDWHGDAASPIVRIWTAVRDQDAGQPAQLTLSADDEVLVAAEPGEIAEPAAVPLPKHYISLEARCLSCGETYVPNDEDDLEHAMHQDGTDCGGPGVITGAWG